MAAVQLARAYGMVVIGTAGTSDGEDIVQQAGAHHVFNHRTPDYAKKIMVQYVVLKSTIKIQISALYPISASGSTCFFQLAPLKTCYINNNISRQHIPYRNLLLFLRHLWKEAPNTLSLQLFLNQQLQWLTFFLNVQVTICSLVSY